MRKFHCCRRECLEQTSDIARLPLRYEVSTPWQAVATVKGGTAWVVSRANERNKPWRFVVNICISNASDKRLIHSNNTTLVTS